MEILCCHGSSNVFHDWTHSGEGWECLFHCLFFPEVCNSRELSFYIKSKTSKHLHRNEKIFHNGQFEKCKSYSPSLRLWGKLVLSTTFLSFLINQHYWKHLKVSLWHRNYPHRKLWLFFAFLLLQEHFTKLPMSATPPNPIADVNRIIYWKTWRLCIHKKVLSNKMH